MISRRFRLSAVPVLLAAVLLGLAAPMPAQAAFTSTGTVITPLTSATLQPALAVLLPGGIACAGTVQVNWTPSLSYVTGVYPGYGFDGAAISYTVTLTSPGYSSTKTVTGGASNTVVFNSITLFGLYSATVTASYKGWTSTVTASAISRGCLF